MQNKIILLIFLSIFMNACSKISYFSPRAEQDYLNAQSIPPLNIPPGLKSDTFSNQYPLAEKSYGAIKPVSIVPPGL